MKQGILFHTLCYAYLMYMCVYIIRDRDYEVYVIIIHVYISCEGQRPEGASSVHSICMCVRHEVQHT